VNQYKWLSLATLLIGIGIVSFHLTVYAAFLFLHSNACRMNVFTVPGIVLVMTVCVLLGVSTALVLAYRVLTTPRMPRRTAARMTTSAVLLLVLMGSVSGGGLTFLSWSGLCPL
jgi:hypothetical protein